MTTIIVALIAAISSIICTVLTMKQNKKVNESHHQLTVNHHSSTEPTVMDRLDNIESAMKSGFGKVDSRMDAHIEWHLTKDK